MTPWWDSTLLWSGVGVIVGAMIAAIIAVIVIARLGEERRPPT